MWLIYFDLNWNIFEIYVNIVIVIKQKITNNGLKYFMKIYLRMLRC